MTPEIAADRWVRVHYRLFDSQGEPVENGERELTYLHGGYGAVFERIEAVLEGAQAGDHRSVYLEPIDTFGDYDVELVQLAPRALFPDDLAVGMSFEGLPGEAPDGQIHIVTDLTDDTVVLDANHPLAGMALRFELHVLEVRDASDEEVAEERRQSERAAGDDA